VQRTKYLEIYPSEVAARKISKHLDKMAEVKPRVYQKTLLRYKKLAYLLIECVTKIIRMLQSEMLLSSGDAEFQELASDFDMEQIDELRNSIDDLGSLVDKTPKEDNKRVVGDTLKQYRTVFKQASDYDFGYSEVNDCADLLNCWLTHRFSGNNVNFKYQIRQLPVWATYIVIAYGKYHSIGNASTFVSDFKKWCNDLDTDLSNCWALPLNIFNMTKKVNPDNFTVDAMVIYDILINGCLYQLIDGKNKIPMEPAYIADLVKAYRPEHKKEVRTRLTKQQELIKSLNLHSTADDAEEMVL
jgi:hypothetical protein